LRDGYITPGVAGEEGGVGLSYCSASRDVRQ